VATQGSEEDVELPPRKQVDLALNYFRKVVRVSVAYTLASIYQARL